MNSIINLPAFITAGILLNLTPGADTMYILGRSIAQGKKAGIYSALGIVTGILCHTTFAAFGLSLIVAKSALAFDLIKYSGAVYLTYLGIKMIAQKKTLLMDTKLVPVKADKLFLSGILTNVLNPKVALFFLVFMPQFIKPGDIHNPVPYLILGVIFVIPCAVWSILQAIFAGMLSNKIKRDNRVTLWLNNITGGVFIALGLKLAVLSKQ